MEVFSARLKIISTYLYIAVFIIQPCQFSGETSEQIKYSAKPGRTAAYDALSPDGRFASRLQVAPDGTITWTD
jgi:hypothetical protein